MKKFPFSKNLRLLSRNEFAYVFESSYKFTTQEIITLFKINNLTHPRIGIIITKKNIKDAYKRNNIKRHIRESFRIHQYALPKMDFIIIIRKNIININKYELNKKLKFIWHHNYVTSL